MARTTLTAADLAFFERAKFEQRKANSWDFARKVVLPIMNDKKLHHVADLKTTVLNAMEKAKFFLPDDERGKLEHDLATGIRNAMLKKEKGTGLKLYLALPGNGGYQHRETAPEAACEMHAQTLAENVRGSHDALGAWDEFFYARFKHHPKALSAMVKDVEHRSRHRAKAEQHAHA